MTGNSTAKFPKIIGDAESQSGTKRDRSKSPRKGQANLIDSFPDNLEPETAKGMSSSLIMKKIIYNYMNPTLIPYRNFREEFMIKAFDAHIAT